MFKRFIFLILYTAFFTALLGAQITPSSDEIIWYRSNASGMALELLPSRIAAMRNEYSLSVETIDPERLPRALPRLLVPYYQTSYQIELQILHKEGEEYRRQWLFKDYRGLARIVASGSSRFFDSGSSGDEQRTGFIEIFDAIGALASEIRYEDDLSEWEFRFFYRDNILLRTETWHRVPPAPSSLVFTDTFRYTRSGSIRAIDRLLHEELGQRSRISFPRIGPDLSPVVVEVTHGSAFTSEFLSDIYFPEGSMVSYNLDNRGRIVSELWRDADGRVLGEFRNSWADDRMLSVLWSSSNDNRLVEYEYDMDGNRIVERNIRGGVLERSVTSRDGIDIEEIYINDRLVLRAFWEGGIKISEERISIGGDRR